MIDDANLREANVETFLSPDDAASQSESGVCSARGQEETGGEVLESSVNTSVASPDVTMRADPGQVVTTIRPIRASPGQPRYITRAQPSLTSLV